ncbi:Small membrane protein [Lacticaseibacillus paracasei subsp. paracasei Lpp37]|nr:Small membrane protein [Lacticaseibacillus paracasei subsp. paracasei Lpp37]
MAEVNTRKAYREAQEKEQHAARAREAKRVEVEKDYARKSKGKPEIKNARFDEVTFRKVNSLKKKIELGHRDCLWLAGDCFSGTLFWVS